MNCRLGKILIPYDLRIIYYFHENCQQETLIQRTKIWPIQKNPQRYNPFYFLLYSLSGIIHCQQFENFYKELFNKSQSIINIISSYPILLSMFGRLTLLICLILAASCGYNDVTDFWNRKLGVNTTFESYTGYEAIDWYYPFGKSQMHYQLFSAHGHSAKNGSNSTPVFVWLQGGPGSSSMFGAYTEVGPILIKNGTPKLNEWSWNLIGHTLFIDSPLNVGFSYSEGDRKGKNQVSSTDIATNHLVNFLHSFYTSWPHLKKNPLYLTGESFAGHYLPNLAKKILMNNTALNFNLQGVAIGDGWTDPLNQINYYDSYLWSVGVIGNKFRDTCNWFQTRSVLNIYQGNMQKATDYFDFLTNNDTTPQYYMGNISIFNFRNYDGLDESFAKFLTDNRQQMKIDPNLQYIPGNEAVYTAFGEDVSKGYASDVATVVGRVKTLIYNGQNDVVVNTPGVLQYLNGLNWHGARAWKRAKKNIWKINGKVHGWAKVSDNLWFVLVNGAGHMVPTDQPIASLVMLGHFVHNEHDWDL